MYICIMGHKKRNYTTKHMYIGRHPKYTDADFYAYIGRAGAEHERNPPPDGDEEELGEGLE